MLKYIIALLLLLPAQSWGGVFFGFGQSTSGRVGAATNASLTLTGQYPTANRAFFSPYTSTAAGDVAYIFIDVGSSGANPAYLKLFIADASLNVVASASNCTATNVTGTVYRYALSSTYTLSSSTTYNLGFASGDGVFDMWYTPVSGSTIYADTTTYTDSTCPGSVDNPLTQNLNYGSVYTFEGKVKIWVSNNANDY